MCARMLCISPGICARMVFFFKDDFVLTLELEMGL